MFCFKCGKEIRDDALFCNYCGAETMNKAAAQPVYTEPAATEVPVTPISSEPAEEETLTDSILGDLASEKEMVQNEKLSKKELKAEKKAQKEQAKREKLSTVDKRQTVKSKVEDKVLNIIPGVNIETVKVSVIELAQLVDQWFIQSVETPEQLKKIEKACSKNAANAIFTTSKTVDSLDGRYFLHVRIGQAGEFYRNNFFVKDCETEKIYEIDKKTHLKAVFKEIDVYIEEKKKANGWK